MVMEESEPVRLTEDAETGDRFLVYATGKGLRIDIQYEGETLWMTQAQIGQLFGRDVSTVSRHITNVISDGELDDATSLQKMQKSAGRPTTLYSLDMVISVGYRVSSAQATTFRRWATSILVQFARKGFVVDSQRLKASEDSERISELRDIIRDIRSDEANVYRELKRICSLCLDYDPRSDGARTFYQRTQAKLVYAVTSLTRRVDCKSRNHNVTGMGLTTWPGDNIRKSDVLVSKNYLYDGELKELNRLTTILLDIFEDQADIGRVIVMIDATTLLDKQLLNLGRAVLRSGGSIKTDEARRKAEEEYRVYAQNRKQERQAEADEQIAALASEAKALSRKPRA